MTSGYLYMLLALLSFSLIGLGAKMADNRKCRVSALYALVYGWALAMTAAFVVLLRGGSFEAPATVYRIAIPFGMSAAIAGLAFQIGMRYGKISTSWLVLNLSAAIPTVLSVVVYREPVGLRKVVVLALVVISILLLWKDKKVDDARAAATGKGVR